MVRDNRGYLVKVSQRAWKETFYTFSQAGVLRGMHWQEGVEKLVHCISGDILDVLCDPVTGKVSAQLLGGGSDPILVPPNIAHGFYAYTDCIVLYQMSEEYDPAREAGLRWNSFGMVWPNFNPVLSDRDKQLPYFRDLQ